MLALRQLVHKSLVPGRAACRFSAVARPALVCCLDTLQQTTRLKNEQQRTLSSYGGNNPPPRFIPKTFPQYNIHGENCMLAVKLMSPTFRLRSESLVVEQNRRGRILLEFTPRGSDGKENE